MAKYQKDVNSVDPGLSSEIMYVPFLSGCDQFFGMSKQSVLQGGGQNENTLPRSSQTHQISLL